jgi:hypothetical protein
MTRHCMIQADEGTGRRLTPKFRERVARCLAELPAVLPHLGERWSREFSAFLPP